MNAERKTLVILTPGFPENEEDSTCLPMHQQLLRSLKENHPELDLRVLSFQYPYHTKRYNWHGLPVIPFSGRNKGGITKLLLRKKTNTALRVINDFSKISGILSFWYGECALVGQHYSERTGTPHYCWILGQDAKKENKYPKRTRLKGGQLIALSDFIQDEFEKNHGTRPAHVIPPGIDQRLFTTASSEKEIDILGAGSLIPLKQFDVFIRVVTDIKKHIPNLKAVLAGNGPEMTKLESLANELGLESSIELTGELPYDQVIELMQKAKVFLHTSLYEGFGMVCLEALAAGAQTISFVQPMKQEIPGWHMVNRPEEMTELALKLLTKPETPQATSKEFEIKNTAKKFVQLFFG